jgi:diguanylate cyclase (GGDEF)-like protein/PAS domain S-box-containing protein
MIRPDLHAPAASLPVNEPDAPKLAEALAAALDGVAVFGEDLSLRYANRSFCAMYRAADFDDLIERLDGDVGGWARLFDEDELHRINDDIVPLVSRSGSWRGRLRANRCDGTSFMAKLSFARIPSGGFVAVVRDVTAEAAAEETLKERQEMYSLLAENSTDVISLHEVDGRIVYISPSSLRLMGCEVASLVGRHPWNAIHPDDVEQVRDTLAKALDGGAGIVSYRLKVKSGVWIWFETIVRAVTNGQSVERVQCSTRDVSARMSLEAQLEHQVLHDPLTGLPNRSLFMDRLSQAPLHARRVGKAYGIVYLDLDRFKQVNDRLGHAAGDQLLVQVADRLRAQMRESDTLARLSGDEFAIILENVEDGEIPGQLGPRLLAVFDEPFDVEGAAVSVRPSIGIAIDEDGQSEPESLLRSADLAMYAAKRDPERAYVAQLGAGNGKTIKLRDALRRAIERNELRLHYQPLVAAADRRPVGLEALLRWRYRRAGSVSPPEILAIAEQGEFGAELTRWVLRTALRESRAWLHNGFGDLFLCLNLSEDELANPALGDMIAEAVSRSGTAASALQFELCTGSLRRHAEPLAALRATGAIIALDGFGSDPISLPQLARAPIDALKIARSLVESLGESDGGEGDAAAEAIVGMGNRLGLRVTAEGVETEAQALRLRDMGCDMIQGFHVGRPLPAAYVETYLRQRITVAT